MASASDSLPSPESTVTSLLATSGYLKSSMLSDSSRSIRYKDRQYESATAALEAYIADFQKSLRIPDTSTGRLLLPKDPVTPVLSGTRFRNKDVLKENLTDGELDFLKLPVGSHRRDPETLSLTTDDLLVLPADGSMPVTRTSAYLTKCTSYPLGLSSPSRPLRTEDLSASRRRWWRKDPEAEYILDSRLSRSAKDRLLSPLRSTQKDPPHARSSHAYPRWLTSQKSDMDFSGITSVPDVTYPMWLKDCDATSDPADYRTAEEKLGLGHALPPSPEVPTWVGELESCDEELQGNRENHLRAAHSTRQEAGSSITALGEEAGHRTLRELRLEFAEQLAAAEERERNASRDKPFRGDNIESLILRAEKALASPSLGHPSLAGKDSGSPRTEDVLDADRSWDTPPVAFKSPVPVGGAEDHLNLGSPGGVGQMELRKGAGPLAHVRQAAASGSSGYSSRKHPGPVEALKQMLFSLQAVEQRVTQDQEEKQQDTPILNTTKPRPSEHSQMSEPLFEDYESGPGGQSLQRALHHLGRLKSLVDDMNEKKAQEDQENGV